jgi:hypothetical protein
MACLLVYRRKSNCLMSLISRDTARKS